MLPYSESSKVLILGLLSCGSLASRPSSDRPCSEPAEYLGCGVEGRWNSVGTQMGLQWHGDQLPTLSSI